MPNSRAFQLQCGSHILDLSIPRVMAVLNVTPDSFSDGGSLYRQGKIDRCLLLDRARQMIEQGAAIIDVGGESTRPGAEPVSVQQELDRVIPWVEEIAGSMNVIVSVDTSTPAVMQAAARAGAGLINDVRALQREGAVEVLARTGLPVCLMHMQGEPGSMQKSPLYADVLTDVLAFLEARIVACEQAGIARQKIILDPGFGFGKTLQHNLTLLRRLPEFQKMNLPLLVGMSRKSMIAQVLKREALQKKSSDRLAASLTLAVLAVERGASIVRVHDVRETVDAIKMVGAVLSEHLLPYSGEEKR